MKTLCEKLNADWQKKFTAAKDELADETTNRVMENIKDIV